MARDRLDRRSASPDRVANSKRFRSRSPRGHLDEHKDKHQNEQTNERLTSSPETRPQASSTTPPLPSEDPPLPTEAPPLEDDGWDALVDPATQNYYFYNRFTKVTTWENPRVPVAATSGAATSSYGYDAMAGAPGTTSSSGGLNCAPGTSTPPVALSSPPRRVAGGYNPAIHGDYDPNADYAIEAQREAEEAEQAAAIASEAAAAGMSVPDYTATAAFNRFRGNFQANRSVEYFTDEQRSGRQMNNYFNPDDPANTHDGRSLKAERSGQKLSKAELKAFKEKKKAKKEEKRKAWLKD